MKNIFYWFQFYYRKHEKVYYMPKYLWIITCSEEVYSYGQFSVKNYSGIIFIAYLKKTYRAVNEDVAINELIALKEKWGSKYPNTVLS